MIKRFNELSFVIGLFFFILSLILLAGYLFSIQLADTLNLYTGIALSVFGVLMMIVKSNDDK
jgi:hypothetical protein